MPSRRILTRTASAAPSPGTSIVTDPLEIRRLLSRAMESPTSASIKLRGSEIPLRTHLIPTRPKDGIHLELPVTEEPLDGRDCLVLLYLTGRSVIGLSAQPSQILVDRLVFSPPEKLVKIQRRKNVRYEIPLAYEYTIELDSIEQRGTRVRKRLIDISEDGVSFFVLSPREAGLFREGLVIPRTIIRMQNQTILSSLKVRSQIKIERGQQGGPKGAGNKIGAVFEDISPEDRNYISQVICSHATHLFY
jgi:hypothetical protein